jgi:hypothetical protein
MTVSDSTRNPVEEGRGRLITLDTPMKFLSNGGWAPYGTGRWNLPSDNSPGAWMPDIEGHLVMCIRGYHWCYAKDSLSWLNAECYLIETKGFTLHEHRKSVSRCARLTRRVETWNERTARLFMADCAESVLCVNEEDPTLRHAIEVAREYARGNASAKDLIHAHDVACGKMTYMIGTASVAAARAATYCATQSGIIKGYVMDVVNESIRAIGARALEMAKPRIGFPDTHNDMKPITDKQNAIDAARRSYTNRFLQYLNGEVS